MNDSKKARICLQRIVELFKAGQVPKALAVTTIPPQADIPSAKWSWSNKLLQFLADTSDARGYRQWEQAERQVKKGAKAFHILGLKTKKLPGTDDDGREVRVRGAGVIRDRMDHIVSAGRSVYVLCCISLTGAAVTEVPFAVCDTAV